MASKILTTAYLEEFRREIPASRKCLENLTADTFGFKPHETSMEMRYLALLVAEIPLWIVYMLDKGELDFATYPRFEFKTVKELVDHFEDNIKKAEALFEKADDETLEQTFTLKRDGAAIYTLPLKIDIPTTLNHWVHHRGQLTVYMRMNEIKVPSIYGPSGDEKTF
ncbi:MAG TPA: DinB family protein [Flavobacterium sp.]|nr:DinB family protein [Flavobacterium sp.]